MKGIIASPGIAIGKALLFAKQELHINRASIKDIEIEDEINLFNNACCKSYKQLEKLIETTRKTMGTDKAAILNAQLDILRDPLLKESVLRKIQNEKTNAETALDLSSKEIYQMFESLDDPYFKERAADVKDVFYRILSNLKGVSIVTLDNIKEECIIVAKDLTPSDTAAMDLSKVLGFITDMGGATSHVAIMAKSLEIPAIVGLADASYKIKNDDTIIIDALKGEIFINPSESAVKVYENKKREYLEHRKKLIELKDLPSVTTDNRKVEICANIGNTNEINSAIQNGADGIGLFRTEFLYMNSSNFPTEEEQFRVYKDVAQKMNGKPVVIRTLDIGGDKVLPYFSFPEEQNPFLGWRAIRICLDKVDVFKVQLRAILRASAFGKVLIMYPMVISLEELRSANSILSECKNELNSEGISFDKDISVGIMIETPAAVLLADELAKEVDFFSIGTNDLTQYILAVDRGNEKISKMYNPFHPAVIRSIKKVIDSAHNANIHVGMCGELAGDKKAALLLLGMGLDEFSMSAISIPIIKNLIRSLSFQEVVSATNKVLNMSTSSEIEDYLEKFHS